MPSLFSCPDSYYACFENFILGTLGIVSSGIFIIAYRKIYNDKSTILDRIDRFIFLISVIQIIGLAVYFTFMSNTFLLSTIRAFRLVSEIVLCMVFLYTYIEKEKQAIYYKFMQIGIVGAFALWFYSAILHQDSISYKCIVADYLIFSTLTLLVTSFTFITGCMTIYVNNEFSKEKEINQESTGQNKIAYEELQKIKLQLQVFMFGGFGTSLIQFLWDYIAYMNSYTITDCSNYYDSTSIISLIYFILFKLITLYIPPFIVFYVYYYRNQSYFNGIASEEKENENLKVFYDARSDLLEEMELDEKPSHLHLDPNDHYNNYENHYDHIPHPAIPHMTEQQYYFKQQHKDSYDSNEYNNFDYNNEVNYSQEGYQPPKMNN